MGQNQFKSYVVRIHGIPVSYTVDDELSRTLPESCIVNTQEGRDVTFSQLVDALKPFPGVDLTRVQFYYKNEKNYPIRNQRDLESLRAAGFFRDGSNFTLEYAGTSPIVESESKSEDESSSESSLEKKEEENARAEFVKDVISHLDAGIAELTKTAAAFKDEITAVKLAQENLAKEISELRETTKRPDLEVKGKAKSSKRQKIDPPLPMD